MSEGEDAARRRGAAAADYRKKLLHYKELDSGVLTVIIKASSGLRYVNGCRSKVDREKLTTGTHVVLNMATLTSMCALP